MTVPDAPTSDGPQVEQRYEYARARTRVRFCAQCKRTFLASRSDAVFCAGSCRQRRYRARHGSFDRSEGECR